MNFIVFIIATILGILTMKYAKTLTDWGLRSAWADEHLPLGSVSGWKLFGLAIIIFGVAKLFGLL